MAINPFRVGELQLPPNPRPVPIDFSFLSDIGGAIGGYRRQQELADIAQGATDASGNLDPTKFATALALRGRGAEARQFLETAFERQRMAQQAEQFRQSLELKRQELEQGRITQGVHVDPNTGQILGWRAGPEGFKTFPLGKGFNLPPPEGAPPTAPPTTPPPTTPGPQSALEPGPATFSERFLGGGEQAPARGVQVASLEPGRIYPAETIAPPPELPPTRVAEAASAAATAAPAVTAAAQGRRDPRVLQLNPEMAGQIRAWAEYEEAPPKAPGLHDVIRAYRPDWKASQYEIEQEKRKGEAKVPTLSAEMAGRLGIGSKFQLSLQDRGDKEGNVIPGVLSRIQGGELNRDWNTALQAQYYKGGAGEIRQLIDDGAEALERMLTGAAMNKEEARDYANRFRFRIWDNPLESETKVRNLNDILLGVQNAVKTGKATPDELRNIIEARPSTLRGIGWTAPPTGAPARSPTAPAAAGGGWGRAIRE
jgi:hypothetical protein